MAVFLLREIYRPKIQEIKKVPTLRACFRFGKNNNSYGMVIAIDKDDFSISFPNPWMS